MRVVAQNPIGEPGGVSHRVSCDSKRFGTIRGLTASGSPTDFGPRPVRQNPPTACSNLRRLHLSAVSISQYKFAPLLTGISGGHGSSAQF